MTSAQGERWGQLPDGQPSQTGEFPVQWGSVPRQNRIMKKEDTQYSALTAHAHTTWVHTCRYAHGRARAGTERQGRKKALAHSTCLFEHNWREQCECVTECFKVQQG